GERGPRAADDAEREKRIHSGNEKHASGDHGGGVDERAHRRRAFHRVRQPDVQRELPRLTDGTAENQERDKCGTRAERNECGAFEATASIVVKEQRAAAAVEPENAKKKSEVTDASGD